MIDQRFVDRSRQFLTATYLSKIEAAAAPSNRCSGEGRPAAAYVSPAQ